MGVLPDTHDLQRVGSIVKVIAIIALIAGLGWAIYAGIIRPVTKPNPTNRQEGQRDNYNVTIAPKSYFGCMRFDIKKPDDVNKK